MTTNSGNAHPLQRGLVLAAYGAATLAGLKYGYDFGVEISGTVLGVVLAVNSAVFCSVAVGTVIDWVRQTLHKRAADRHPPSP